MIVRTNLIKLTVVFVLYADFSKGKAVFLRIRRPGKIQPLASKSISGSLMSKYSTSCAAALTILQKLF
jgi:hypothetical protein